MKGLRIVLISAYRFLCDNGMKLRRKTRRIGSFILIQGLLGTVGIMAVFIVAGPNSPHWLSLFNSMIGLGFGGLSIWLVRLVASHSLGQEAMGFGDVTLLAMIGAFLGWQASLITFALAPLTALWIALVYFLITKENELAFGPYLCAGAFLSVLFWPTLWPIAREQFFRVPQILLGVLAGSLVLLMLMMLGVRRMRANSDGLES